MSTEPLQISKCRSEHCGADIVWLKTRGGKNMPVDAGTVNLTNDAIFDGARHTSHYATCPDANRFRKGTGK